MHYVTERHVGANIVTGEKQ